MKKARAVIMSFDIPPSIEPMIQQYALEQSISHDEAVVRLVKEGFSATHENYNHLFTPDRLAHLDGIVVGLDQGEATIDIEQVDARLAAAKADWMTKNAS